MDKFSLIKFFKEYLVHLKDKDTIVIYRMFIQIFMYLAVSYRIIQSSVSDIFLSLINWFNCVETNSPWNLVSIEGRGKTCNLNILTNLSRTWVRKTGLLFHPTNLYTQGRAFRPTDLICLYSEFKYRSSENHDDWNLVP